LSIREYAVVEVLVAGALVAGGVAVVARRNTDGSLASGPHSPHAFIDADYQADLPCPWCNAQTREDDPRCPSCGQRFG